MAAPSQQAQAIFIGRHDTFVQHIMNHDAGAGCTVSSSIIILGGAWCSQVHKIHTYQAAVSRYHYHFFRKHLQA